MYNGISRGNIKMKRIPVNSTLIFTGIQALFAAKAGAEYVSPFVGRLDDIGEDVMLLDKFTYHTVPEGRPVSVNVTEYLA